MRGGRKSGYPTYPFGCFITFRLALDRKESVMQALGRFKPQKIPLTEFIWNVRQRAVGMPDGPERDKLLEKIRDAQSAATVAAWANSPGLQSRSKRTGTPRTSA
jgi:hypothetical protein